MKLTVLGCWAPYPKAGGACSGYLLQDHNINILIDCGNGSFSELQKHVDFRQLDAVVISHLHADHYLDVFCLVHAIRGSLRDGSRKRPLDIYLPDSPSTAFSTLIKYKDELNINLYDKLPGQGKEKQMELGSLVFKFNRTTHPIKTYAVSVEGSSKFVYSADTAFDEGLIEFAKDTTLFLCEASLIEEDIEYTKVGHMTARQAGETAKRAGAKKLVLTHLWPEYELSVISKEGSAGYGGEVQLAKEGEIYIF